MLFRSVSQDLSEFALHLRAMLGLPIHAIDQRGPSVSCAIVREGDTAHPRLIGTAAALTDPGTELRLFGKPAVHGQRRLGVALARAESLEQARDRARRAAGSVQLKA